MNNSLIETGMVLVVAGCSGFFTSWSPPLRQLRLWRWLLLALVGIFLLLPLSALLHSDTLGWIFGLSLIFILPLLVVFGIGVLLGNLLVAKDEGKGNEKVSSATPPNSPNLKVDIEALQRRANALLIVVGVGAGFAVLIGSGFKISGDPTPAAVSIAYGPSIAVLLAVIGILVWRLAMNRPPRYMAPTSKVDSQRWKAERQQFLAELDADPVRRPYLALIKRGEHWSADRIAYDLESAASATCDHLRPIERAMREAGIRVRLQSIAAVHAACVIDAQALAQKFDLPLSVAYAEPQQYDRSMEDPPSAWFVCSECRSRIDVVHHMAAASDTPTWPARKIEEEPIPTE
jgi:hypothetical protein